MFEDEPKPILAHVEELRARLLRCLIVFGVVFLSVATLPSFDRSVGVRVFKWLSASLLPAGTHLVFLDAFEPAWVLLKVAMAITLFLLSPYLLFESFAFLAPAFAEKQRKTLAAVLFCGMGLFALGMAFSYYAIVPSTLSILTLIGTAAGGVAQMTFDRFYTFVLTMLLVFGVPFELPLVLAFLIHFEFVTLGQLRAFRRYAYLGIVAVSAAITPDPTPFSQCILSAALIVLYELGLLACLVFEKRAGAMRYQGEVS